MNLLTSLVLRAILRPSLCGSTKGDVNHMLEAAGIMPLYPMEFGTIRDAINLDLSAGNSTLLTMAQAEAVMAIDYHEPRGSFHKAEAYERKEFYETMVGVYALLGSLKEKEDAENARVVHLAFAKCRAEDLAKAYGNIEAREHSEGCPL